MHNTVYFDWHDVSDSNNGNHLAYLKNEINKKKLEIFLMLLNVFGL